MEEKRKNDTLFQPDRSRRKLLAVTLVIVGLALLAANIGWFSVNHAASGIASLGTEIGTAAGEMGRELGQIGTEIGVAAGEMGRDLGQTFGDMGRDLGQTFGSMGRDLGRTMANLWPLLLIGLGLVFLLRRPRTADSSTVTVEKRKTDKTVTINDVN